VIIINSAAETVPVPTPAMRNVLCATLFAYPSQPSSHSE
jgi:hypothetical protein